MKHLNVFDWVALILLVIGGINWGMIGIFNVDLVSGLFGVTTILTRIIFVMVGLAAIHTVYILAAKVQ